MMAIVTMDTFLEFVAVDKYENLDKNIFTGIHDFGFAKVIRQLKSKYQRTFRKHYVFYTLRD